MLKVNRAKILSQDFVIPPGVKEARKNMLQFFIGICPCIEFASMLCFHIRDLTFIIAGGGAVLGRNWAKYKNFHRPPSAGTNVFIDTPLPQSLFLQITDNFVGCQNIFNRPPYWCQYFFIDPTSDLVNFSYTLLFDMVPCPVIKVKLLTAKGVVIIYGKGVDVNPKIACTQNVSPGILWTCALRFCLPSDHVHCNFAP